MHRQKIIYFFKLFFEIVNMLIPEWEKRKEKQ